MKRYIYKIFAALFLLAVMISCRKEEKLDVDFSTYNIDNPIADTELDNWLTTTFLDQYNIEVIYRYNRFYHGDDRDVAAVKVEKVEPQMQTVLEGFILPYSKIAGVPFIKRMVPKQFVLFGSGSYNPDNSYTLATAAAGRNITIYDLNNFDLNNTGAIVGKLRTIHHEFTHILNQIVPMPADFVDITKSTYKSTWTTVSDATARSMGYVTPYASSQAGEDFAETTTSLLVLGQAWFDAWANGSTPEGKAALKAKEASVAQYFTVNLGIDFRALQKEIQGVVRDTYKYQNASFRYWMGQNLFKSMTIDLNDAIYTTYGISSDFSQIYNGIKASVEGLSGYGLTFNRMRLNFTSSTTMVMEISFNQGASAYLANYDFGMTVNTTTGQTKFTLSTNASTGNASLLRSSVQPMLDYLNNTQFVADWMPANINADNFNQYGGFYESGTPTNYFYGLLGQ